MQDIRLVYLKTCDQYIKRFQPRITENSKKVSKGGKENKQAWEL